MRRRLDRAAREGRMSIDSPNFEGLDRWAFEPRRVEKPWGWELIWADTELYVGKILFVRAGHSLSLQFHNEKDESWWVESGRATFRVGDGEVVAEHGHIVIVPANTPHGFTNTGGSSAESSPGA